MNVLSLFDGMGCGRLALHRAGIPVRQYISSEIDKYAIKVSRANWRDITHLGCVTLVRQMADAGAFGHVDLLLGGSPCQGFSFAGKQLAFQDPRSILFFEYVRILAALRKHNPNIKFLLENVPMKKQHRDVITQFLGVQPVFINSALVSAQNRQRYYWCNWSICQPFDRGILLRHIIQDADTQLSTAEVNYMNRAVSDGRNHWDFGHHSDTANAKSAPIVANFSKGVPYNVLVDRVTGGAVRGRYLEGNSGATAQGLEVRFDGKSNAVTTVEKDSVLVNVGSTDGLNRQGSRIYSDNGKAPTLLNIGTGGAKPPLLQVRQINPSKDAGGKQPYMQDRIFDVDGKSHALTASFAKSTNVGKRDIVGINITDGGYRPYKNDGRKGSLTEIGTIGTPDHKAQTITTINVPKLTNSGELCVSETGITYRKLTPIECERLQGLPDNYTAHVSNTQRYKMLGNGWQVDTIEHIFREMPR